MSLIINPFFFSDPYRANVKTLLHFEGTDGSTTFTDTTGLHTWTAAGGAQIDTAQFLYGASSGLFDGSGDGITSADSADWTLGTSDFTIEFALRLNNNTINHAIFGMGTSANDFWGVHLELTGGGRGLRFVHQAGGSPTIDINQGATTGWSTGTWYQCAFERSGTTFRLYRGGTVIGSGTDADSIADLSASLQIGSDFDGGAGVTIVDYNGWLDEFRWTLGVARYGGAYTPPTTAFPY